MRGVTAGVCIPSLMDVARRWGLGNEPVTWVSIGSVPALLASGMGPFVAGMVCEIV